MAIGSRLAQLHKRLTALEGEAWPQRGWVIYRQEHETHDQALQRSGIQPALGDLVVLVTVWDDSGRP